MRWRDRPPIPNPGTPGTLLVPLSKGKVSLIDEADGEVVARHCWFAIRSSDRFYAAANIGGRQTKLHRYLWAQWGLSPSEIDHANGDPLDNRRENLRSATRSENRANSRTFAASGAKGVYDSDGRWRAMGCKDGKRVHLGTFDTIQEASDAYMDFAIRKHGQFARAK